MQKYLRISKKSSTFAPAFREKLRGAIAQLVEQRTENPCVPGSIPGGTTRAAITRAALNCKTQNRHKIGTKNRPVQTERASGLEANGIPVGCS